MDRPFELRWRALIAGLAGVLGSALLLQEVDGTYAVLIPIAGLVLAGGAAHANHLGAQLFARAAWWSNLLLGLFITLVGSQSERAEGVTLALGCGVALLVADRKALVEATARGGYSPIAYRGTLQVVMVLALADMQTLLLFGSLAVADGTEGAGLVLLGAAAAMTVGFVGLYRLRFWGVLVTTATALVLAVAILARVVRLDDDIVPALLVLAALQLTAPAPMAISLLRRRPLRGLSIRGASVAASVVVAVVMGVAVIAGATR